MLLNGNSMSDLLKCIRDKGTQASDLVDDGALCSIPGSCPAVCNIEQSIGISRGTLPPVVTAQADQFTLHTTSEQLFLNSTHGVNARRDRSVVEVPGIALKDFHGQVPVLQFRDEVLFHS